MIRFVCDTPDRVTARLFLSFGTTACPCCNFWRGALFGGIVGITPAIGMAVGPGWALLFVAAALTALRVVSLVLADKEAPHA